MPSYRADPVWRYIVIAPFPPLFICLRTAKHKQCLVGSSVDNVITVCALRHRQHIFWPPMGFIVLLELYVWPSHNLLKFPFPLELK